MGDFFTVVGTVLAVVAVLFLCWFSTRKLAGFSRFQASGTKVRLLDQVVLGQDKGIALIKLGDKYWLVGVASTVNLLTEVDPKTMEMAENEQVPDLRQRTVDFGGVSEFRQLFEKIRDRKK